MSLVLTIHDIRHANLVTLVERFGTLQALAEKVGTSHSQLSQYFHRTKHSATGKQRQVGEDFARLLEVKCELPFGWMDNVHKNSEPSPEAMEIAHGIDRITDPARRQTVVAMCRLAVFSSPAPAELSPGGEGSTPEPENPPPREPSPERQKDS